MKELLIYSSVLFLGLPLHTSLGKDLFHEAFDYPKGELPGKGPWKEVSFGEESSKSTDLAPLKVVTGSLNYEGLVASTGNSVELVGAGKDAVGRFPSEIKLDPKQRGLREFYVSFLIKVEASGRAPGGLIFSLLSEEPRLNQLSASVFVRPQEKKKREFEIGLKKRGSVPESPGGSTEWLETKPLTLGQTHLVVLRVQHVDGANNDIYEFWVNPPANSFGAGSAPPSDLKVADDKSERSSFYGFILVQKDDRTPKIQMDEFRFATKWADVTPR